MALPVRMRLMAEACRPFDCVPWAQMADAVPLPAAERVAYCRHTGHKLPRGAALVRFDARKLFLHVDDMAVCVYDYPRSFA